MSLFGRVFGKPTGAEEEDDAEVERCLQQISDARHAEDRRDAMQQLCGLVKDNMRAQAAIGTMGLPVLLSVLQEDRDDLELLKGALEVLHASTALPEGGTAAMPPAGGPEDAGPPPALITADLFCRAPDNVLMLLSVLRPAPEGCEDFYVRYTALQALGALLVACPDKLQAAVLSSPVGVTSLMEVLAQPLEVLRNEALLLLVGLCSDCPEVAKLAAFEGAFEKLLPLCAADGGPSSGDVVVADAAELINNLLRGNTDIQRLFREMGFISQLPPLLEFAPPAAAAAAAQQAPPPAGAASGFFAAAASYADPSLRAAASAAANSAVGVAAAAAAAAAGAAASLWPLQVSANYLCLLETARVLLAAPHAASEAQREQEVANRTANQEALGQLGLLQRLVALSIPGAPSAAVRAQALFCAGDLVWGHAGLQEYLASITVLVPAQQQQELPYLQAVLRLMLHSAEPMERAGASHLLQGFCHGNVHGKPAVIATVVPAAAPSTFGEELLAALLAQQQQQQHLGQAGCAASLSPTKAGGGTADQQLQLQLVAGRAGMALAHLLDQNPSGAQHLLGIRLPATSGGPASGAAAVLAPPLPPPPGPPGAAAAAASGDNSTVMRRAVHLLSEGARRPDGQALPLCYSMLRLLIAWCNGCGAAVSALLADSSHLPLLVDLVGGRLPAGDVHTAGLAAVLLGVCLMYAPGSPVAAQQPPQQQQHALQQPPSMLAPPPMHLHQQLQQVGAAVGGGGLHFDALLDVLLSRVGLSQFVAAIDSMQASPLFQAARAAPRLPTHITRSMAGAILESEVAGAARGAAAAAGGAALVGGALGLLSQAAGPSSGGGAAAAGHPDAQKQHQQHHHASAPEAQPYDQPFTLAAEAVAATVQQLTLNAFSSGGGGSSGSMLSPAAGAGFGVAAAPASKLPLPSPQPASVLPPPPRQALPPQFALPQHPAQQPGAPPMHRPLIPLPPAAPGALPMVPLMPGSTMQGGAAAAGASILPGATLSGPSTPAAAATAAAAGAGLAVPTGAPPLTPPSSSLPPAPLSPAPGGPPLGGAAAAVPVAAVPAAVPALQQVQQQLQQAGNEPALSLLGQLQGQTAEAKLLSALDALAQLQASAEELRSRNRSLAEDLIRVSQSKHIGGAAAATANGCPPPAAANGQQPDGGGETAADVDARMAAQLRASRAELELGACRQQLAAMEQRASTLEADAAAAREAAEEARDAAATAQADLSSLSSAYNDLEAHAFKLEEQLQQQQQQQTGGGTAAAAAAATAASGADADARVAAAAAEARAAAEAEAAEEMEDLLACLGEEQAKVEVLAARLGELGQDVDVLLATVAADGGDDGDSGGDGGGAGGEDNELL